VRPSAGWIRLFGQDPSSPGHRAAALARTGASLEQPGLPPTVRTGEYLRWWARLHGMPRPGQRARELLRAWDLPEDAPAERLSQGQRQILQILRCLVPEPSLLVLDEPTSFLDPDSRARFEDGIRQWSARTGGALLVSTHHLEEALGPADRVALLAEGRLRRLAPPEDLFQAPELTRLLRLDPASASLPSDLPSRLPGLRLAPCGTVRGCPAFRIACPGGESDHPALVRILSEAGVSVRSLDRDGTTLREFWESALSAPSAPAAFLPPPVASALPETRAAGWRAGWETGRFQLRLIARERRLLLPVVLLETFLLGSIALAGPLAVPPGAGASALLAAGLLPLGLAASLGADSIAGERERRSLESLLAAPIPPGPLFAGKAWAAIVPGLGCAWIAASAAWWLLHRMGSAPPPAEALALLALVLPSQAAALVSAALLASRRSPTVRGAAQVSALLLLPLLVSAQLLPPLVHALAPGNVAGAWSLVAGAFAAVATALTWRAVARLDPPRLLRLR
jgi:ABC-type multidrug transport system ATPase subunit